MEERYNMIKEATELHPIAEQRVKDGTIATCNNRPGDGHDEALEFAPALAGVASKENPKFSYTEGMCFKQLDFEVTFSPSADKFDQVTVNVNAQNQGFLCDEYVLFAAMDLFTTETISKPGQHTYVFKNMSDNTIADIKAHGLRSFIWCDGMIDTSISLIKTLSMFIGGLSPDPKLPYTGSHVPDYMV